MHCHTSQRAETKSPSGSRFPRMHKYIELYYAIRDDDIAIPHRRICMVCDPECHMISALIIAWRKTTVLQLNVDRQGDGKLNLHISEEQEERGRSTTCKILIF